ncbi:uncharacterized protein F5891DRAFT_1187022 [Suillus fuscotomentosus]|uniref:Uncharacterized protein n=1 Tax=Suillus fuscotomentosus TaxID=1912939 RepID=A0AAD4HMF4_9AGAM|nr:uncharacterized protein F5891DRAFT_1187022 [Suillus fuscotomentosus]KAG1901993.1 hypothetical protein F5891DRAFT_1187022 [Suillus fuscotomentosus]
MSSSWTPDESSETFLAEKGWLQGTVASSIAYGIGVTLFFMCFHLLIRQMTRTNYKKSLPLLIYITIDFILGTLFMASLADFTQLAFIQYRDYPGGPNAFENNMFGIPVDMLGNVCGVLMMALSDGLVVWRCLVIYRGCIVPIWIIMLFPCLMFAGSIAMGIMWLLQLSSSSPFFTSTNINYTVPYLSLSLALNIIITIAIVLRLLTYRHRITKALGSRFGAQYTSIAAMIVESAALYSTFSLALLILFLLNNPISAAFIELLPQIQVVAMLLIVFRVAQGKGWSQDTMSRVMTSKASVQAIRMGDFGYNVRDGSKTFTGSSGIEAHATYKGNDHDSVEAVA